MNLPPARPGMPLRDVDTPALLIDLDAFERNLARMADVAARAGVRLRPHAKTHKSPIIALKQMARGAVGVCCQKVSEAEIMVHGGVGDVLVSNEVVGAAKLERLALLARQAKVGICVDHPDQVNALAAAAGRQRVRLDVLVEIDVGGARCGVPPGDAAVALAQQITRQSGLRFAGLQAYHGAAQHKRGWDERRSAISVAIQAARMTRDALAGEGLACETIGGAGTGTYPLEAASGVYTELQAGSYIFMDADYARNRREDGATFDAFEHALFVHATIMSLAGEDRAVVDAGHKALAVDSGMPEPHGLAGVRYHRPSDEHGVLDTTAANTPLALGQKIMLIPGHCDPTVNLHDWYVCIRAMGTPDAHVEAVWPVSARGALT